MAEISRFYSRQTAALGPESFHKVQHLHVLVSGLRGPGIECAKNLILCGVGEVTIHDDTILSFEELASSFFLSSPSEIPKSPSGEKSKSSAPKHESGQKTRSQAYLGVLQALNPQVKVFSKEGRLDEAFISQFSLVIFTESNLSSLIHLNHFCRTKNPPIGFICCENWGAFGYMFVDFGPEFITYDKTGEENRSYYISNITKENPGIVTVYDRHYLQDGNYVIFKEVQGMEEINNTPPRPIRVVNNNSFSIEDTTGYSFYLKEGVAEHFKIPDKIRFKSLEVNMTKPTLVAENIRRAEHLHIITRAISEYAKLHNELPGLNNDHDASQVLLIAQSINESSKESNHLFVEEIDKTLLYKISHNARWQLAVFSAYWGGLLCSEVIKFTGKYTPLTQWMNYDWLDLVPEGKKNVITEINSHLAKSRGIIVGVGALGSEVLKLCVQSGVKDFIVADKGKIKQSDCHLLYSSEAIGQQKAMVACERLSAKDDHLRIRCENNDIAAIDISDNEWDGIHWVISAVDNHSSREAIDKLCVWHEKPMIEGSFSGTFGLCNVYKPFVSQSYCEAVANPEKPTSQEIIMNFPYNIDHCIEYAKIRFKVYFNEAVLELRTFLEDPTGHLALIPESEKYSKMHILYTYLEILQHNSYEECLKYSREKFTDFFHETISKLLQNYPQDCKDSDGKTFWTGFKKIPISTPFENTDDIHVQFVESFACLLAGVLGIAVGKIPAKDMKEGHSQLRTHTVADLQAILSAWKDQHFLSQVNPAYFDADNNIHSLFVYSLSTIRARCYKILEIDRFTTEIIAGNINGCLSSTCSIVASCICIELYRLFGHNNKNINFNLGSNNFVTYEPAKPKQNFSVDYHPELEAPVKAIPEGFTVWDKMKICGPLTLNGLIEMFNNQHNLKVNLISVAKKCLFNGFSEGNENMEKTFEELFSECRERGEKSLRIEVSCEENNTGIDVLTPVIKYILS
ncbi:hypothetical protein SteCoe_30842 [Stentor coeruleus]|uniref:Ubiquitin-activating enzyme E1 C-terminal domain-containing protein n=1 Tax=Stentor coeruleus TaxID=5963 RepID=A0A1R2B2P2_9CILI|nr:hypothetical protein SteCoe_30842 [Stentor coeruleus]